MNEPKYIRKSFTLEPEMMARIKEAAARRTQCGLDGGNSSAIVRIAVTKFLLEIAVTKFLLEWDKCQLKGTDAKAVD